MPQSVWSKVGDPGKYVDPDPVGAGPYTACHLQRRRASRWWPTRATGAASRRCGEVQFPTFASANTALSALQTNQLDWAGNFIPGVQQVFVSGPCQPPGWFPPVQTNSLEPNLTKFPTNQLAVRKAISLAIDRTAISQQAEGGLEPPVSNASGLTLPIFQQFLSPAVAPDAAGARNPAAAKAVLEQAGYVMGSDGLFRTKSGQELSIDITDPSSFTDYATGDPLVAERLQQGGHQRPLRRPVGHGWSWTSRPGTSSSRRTGPRRALLAVPALQRLAQQRPGDEQRGRRLRAAERPRRRREARPSSPPTTP